MPRCYMVKKRTHEDGPSLCSPIEGSVAPVCYDEDSRYAETRNADYAQLEHLPLLGRSAAETEAAHELLSLAHSLPPLRPLPPLSPLQPLPLLQQLPPMPPLQPRPQLQPQSASVLPVYTYTIQPTNIYIVADSPPQPIYPAVQTVASCPCNYPPEPYIGYVYQPVPPEPVYDPKLQPKPVYETDSDLEPRMDVVTDPDSEPELEIDLEREPETDSEPALDSEMESCRSPEGESVMANDAYSDNSTKLVPQDLSESEHNKVIYYMQPVPTPPCYEEPEPSPSQIIMPDKISRNDEELAPEPQVVTESESFSQRFSEPESRAMHYSEAVRLAELRPAPELRQNGLEEQPRETGNQGLSPPQNWSNKKYVCTDCGKSYATSSNLSRHRQTHRSLDSLLAKRCEECGKVYVSMPALAMHVLTHRMGHVCGTCGKQFSRPWLLRGHLRSHTGEKPYRCPSCGKAFADRSNLRAHQQTHISGRRYICALCNKEFAFKSFLSKHHETGCLVPEVK